MAPTLLILLSPEPGCSLVHSLSDAAYIYRAGPGEAVGHSCHTRCLIQSEMGPSTVGLSDSISLCGMMDDLVFMGLQVFALAVSLALSSLQQAGLAFSWSDRLNSLSVPPSQSLTPISCH